MKDFLRKTKVFLAGVIFTVVLGTSFTAYAAGGQMIEVFYNVKNIVINGVSKMPEEKPFIYKGTTYVPLRYISETLGQVVEWDRETATIYIGDRMSSKVGYPNKNIEPINTQQSPWGEITCQYMGTIVKDNLGKPFNSYLTFSLDWFGSKNFIEFPLNSQYKNLSFHLALTDEYKNTTRQMFLKIFSDDELIFHKELRAGDMPEDINIDVSNTVKLKIEFNAQGGSDKCQIGLFNPKFTM
jgi:hypothetical protein